MELQKKALRKIFYERWVCEANTILIHVGVVSRAAIKYGERGYRYVLMESGYAGQVIYAVSTAINIGCCAIGGYDDDFLKTVLDLHEDEVITSCFVLGKPNEDR